MVDVSKFGPKDAKIIRENEGKTPYELLELGLSQKAYDRLISGEAKETVSKATEEETVETANATTSNVVKPSSVKIIEPKVTLTSPTEYRQQKAKAQSGTVKILNRRTGKVVTLSANAANRLLKNPKEYQLI